MRMLGFTLIATTALWGTAAQGQADAVSVPLVIPTQPMPDALNAFAQQTGLQVIFQADELLASGATAPRVEGTFTPEAALKLLLAGTELRYEYVNPRTIAIRATSLPPKAGLDERSGAFMLAHAQEGGAAGQDAAGPSETTGGGELANQLQEIVVTAEKTSRSLRDTSTSVVVLTASDLEKRPGFDSAKDILARLGNVVDTGKGNFLPAVRGVDGTGPAQGADAFLGGTRPRFAFQLDGRPLGYNETVFGDFGLFDVQQVEVLRGPQSTLQGRNAMGGTIAIRTKDPTFDWHGGLRAVGGDNSHRQGSAYVSGPLIEDQLAFRIAYEQSDFESFAKMPVRIAGRDSAEYSSRSARAKLLIKPLALPGFSTVLTVNHTEFEGPQAEIIAYPFDEHVSIGGNSPIFVPKSTAAIIDSRWECSCDITFENTLSYTDFGVERLVDPGEFNVDIDGHEFVLQPRARFTRLEGRLSALIGAYYLKAHQDEATDFIGGLTFDDATTTSALFSELTYRTSERFDVTAGGRFEREHRDRLSTGIFFVDLDEVYKVFMPKLALAWHTSPDSTLGLVVSRGYNGGGAAFTYEFPFVNYEYDPEYVWNYEAYGRFDLMDKRLSLTANLFYSDYKDFQLPFDINPDPAVFAFVIRNADKVKTYGAELGLRYLALPGLELYADVGLIKTKVASYPGNSVEGNELPRSPRFSSQFGVAYGKRTGPQLSIDARYSGAYFSDIINLASERTRPYWSASAQAAYAFEKVRVFASLENIFDQGRPISLYRGATFADDQAMLLHPRSYKVGISVDF